MRADARILAPLLCYLLGFAFFRPAAFSVVDEGLYVAQAAAFASGVRTTPHTDPLTGAVAATPPSNYPIGTSLLQAPFVRLGGWQSAAWLSVIALIGTVLLLARWLRESGSDPVLALLFLLYLPALVLGRIAMSDVPGACVVTLGLWLLWRSERSGAAAAMSAGMVCTLSAMFRETNLLIVAPFIVGTMVRRERRWPALVAGATIGVLVRFGTFAWMYGDPFFLRDDGAGFTLRHALPNAALYAFALMVLVPGGLVGVWLYRGPRRAELLTAVSVTIVLYVVYGYSATQSTQLQQLVLGPRFLIPIVPLVIVAGAAALRSSAQQLPSFTPYGTFVSIASCAVAFAVHPVIARYSDTQSSIVRTIYDDTPPESTIISNLSGAQKFMNPVYGARSVAYREDYAPGVIPRMRARTAETFVVFVERNDTEFFRADATENSRYLAELQTRCGLLPVREQVFGSSTRLRIWRIAVCQASS